MAWAFLAMSNLKNKCHPERTKSILKSSKVYERVREDAHVFGEEHWNYGRKHSEDARARMSESRTGEGHWAYGKERPEETRKKISEANKGKKTAPEHLPKILAGLKKAQEARSKIDHTFWRINSIGSEIWRIADIVYEEWFNAKRTNGKKPGSRMLGQIIERLAKEHNIETHLRHETMLRYFKEHGNPADNPNWCKKFRS